MTTRRTPDRRRRRIAVFTLLTLLITVAAAAPATAQTDAPPPRTGPAGDAEPAPPPGVADPAPGETTRVIVELATPTRPAAELTPPEEAAQQQVIAETQAAVAVGLDGTGTDVVATFDNVPGLAVEATTEGLDRLRADPAVAAIRPDGVARPLLDVSTALVRADEAWPAADGTGYSVAVIDTGVDGTHDFLDAKVVHEGCFADDTIPNNAPVGDCPNGRNSQAGNEVAGVAIDATGGTFTLTYELETTGDIAFDAPVDDVRIALLALGSIDDGQIAVRGAVGAYDIEFIGTLGRQNLSDLTAAGTNLTGGAGSAVVTVVDGGPDGGLGAAAPCAIAGCGHGTHVAGIAASDGDLAEDGKNYPGVARGANIVAEQVFHNDGGTALAYFSDIVEALDDVYAVRDTHNVAAVNMSLGGFQFAGFCDDQIEPLMYQSVQNLKDEGVATVVASGNDGLVNSLTFPACLSNVISVGNVLSGKGGSQADGVAINSNAAVFLRMLAPGAPITSAIPDPSVPRNATAPMSGTSMAAPHVAGAVALLRQAGIGGGLTEIDLVDQIHGVLRASGPCINDPGNGIGYTRLDVKAAIDWPGLPSGLFWDIDCDYWAEAAIDWLGFDPNGSAAPPEPLATGYPDGSFGPTLPITRAQDARMVLRMFGEPSPGGYTHGFTDVPAWVTDAVNWMNWPGGPASPNPLMTGVGSLFKPNDNITRAEKARQLFRAAGSPPIDASCPATHGFTDVPPWVNEAIRWLTCAAHGPGGTTPIATGYPGNLFLPDNAITRAETSRMLQRFNDAGHVT